MSEISSDLTSVYRTMDAISLQYEPHLGVPTEVRVFGAEISAEVACLSDEDVVSWAIELDSAAQEQGSKQEPLGSEFDRYRTQPPAAYKDDPKSAEAWALQQLRIGVVSRRFRAEYAERFPDRAQTGYQMSEEYLQGAVVAYSTMGRFLSRPC